MCCVRYSGLAHFDAREWPTRDGVTTFPTLREASRWGRRHASEEGHGGAVRRDPTRVRVRDRDDPRGGAEVRRAPTAGARGAERCAADAEAGDATRPATAAAGGRVHRRDPGG